MDIAFDILITFYTYFLRFFVLPVELGTDFLPCSCGKNISIVVDDRRRKGINFIQPVL